MTTQQEYANTFCELVEMLHEAIGVEPPDRGAYADMPEDWYTRHTWTLKQYEETSKKMVAHVKKRHRYMSSKKAEYEVGMFLLNYGWSFEK